MNSRNIYMDILKRKLTNPQTSQINKKWHDNNNNDIHKE